MTQDVTVFETDSEWEVVDGEDTVKIFCDPCCSSEAASDFSSLVDEARLHHKIS